MGLFVTISAVLVAGLAAVLGIWMERDRNKPPRYAWALSALIVMTTLVSLAQSYIDEMEQNELQDDMARLLVTMDKLASDSDDPRLEAMLTQELAAQSRSNPQVVERVAQRVSDDGRDPGEMLGKHLGEAEVEKVARSGTIKPKARPKQKEPEPAPAAAPAAEPATRPARVGRSAANAGEPPAVPTAAPMPTEPAPARVGASAAVAPAAGEPAAEPTAAPMPTTTSAPAPAKKGRVKKPARGRK